MKRSRRVVLQWMGTAAVATASMGFAPRYCYRPGEPPFDAYGRPLPPCSVTYGGFGIAPYRVFSHPHHHFHHAGG